MTISAPITTSPVTISAPVTLGYVGPAGPNSVTTATTTNLTGVLVGDGANVGVKTPAETRAYLDLEDADILAAWEDETGVTVAGLQAADLRHSLIGYASSTEMDGSEGAMTSYYTDATVLQVHIGSGVTSIPTGGFQACTGLDKIVIPGTVTSIGSYAFYGSGLESVVFGEGLTSIGYYAFGVLGISGDVVLPASLTSLGEYTFGYCIALGDVYTQLPFASFPVSALYDANSGYLYVYGAVAKGYTLAVSHGSKTVAEWTSYPDPMP
jgi:hypothetical protein